MLAEVILRRVVSYPTTMDHFLKTYFHNVGLFILLRNCIN